jgi:hypothetical protein
MVIDQSRLTLQNADDIPEGAITLTESDGDPLAEGL